MLHHQHGSIFIEYTVLLTLVSIGALGAIVALGPLLLGLFHYQQAVLLLPVP